jgi:hypothetical protein
MENDDYIELQLNPKQACIEVDLIYLFITYREKKKKKKKHFVGKNFIVKLLPKCVLTIFKLFGPSAFNFFTKHILVSSNGLLKC